MRGMTSQKRLQTKQKYLKRPPTGCVCPTCSHANARNAKGSRKTKHKYYLVPTSRSAICSCSCFVRSHVVDEQFPERGASPKTSLQKHSRVINTYVADGECLRIK